MNRAVSHLAERKELPGAVQNEGLLQSEVSGNEKVTLNKKEGWLWQSHFPLVDGRGLSGRLPTGADYVIQESLTGLRFCFWESQS